jgi:hypothetical protein
MFDILMASWLVVVVVFLRGKVTLVGLGYVIKMSHQSITDNRIAKKISPFVQS